MGVLIDSSVLVDVERAGSGLAERLVDRSDEECLVSVITVSELLHGVHRADDAVRRARRSAFVEGVLDRFPVLPIDLPTARMHAEIRAALQVRGMVVGAHDLWLAAAALAHGVTLATRNVREFERVPGLEVERW